MKLNYGPIINYNNKNEQCAIYLDLELPVDAEFSNDIAEDYFNYDYKTGYTCPRSLFVGGKVYHQGNKIVINYEKYLEYLNGQF